MNTRLYVGNLSFNTNAEGVRTAFTQFGTVSDVHLVTDRETGRSRGFAFVTMGTPEEATKAIEGMDGKTLDGRPLRVNEAEQRQQRGGGGGGGGFRGGGGGGGGYRGGGRDGYDRGPSAGRGDLEQHGRDGSFRSSVRIVNVEDTRREREEEKREQREAKRKAEAERLARLGY
jgi:RNA recognition motif-containing protein